MGIVWQLLGLIVGVVVAYLLWDEYVVGRKDGEESEAEKEIEDDLQELAAEAGMAESVEPLAERAVVEEVAVEEVAVEEVEVEEVEVEPEAEAEAVEKTTEAAEVIVEAEAVDAVEEVAEAEAVVETEVAEAVVDEDAVAETPEPDDLTKIKGIGKVYVARLHDAGIYTYQQIIDTDVEKLEEITQAIQAANAHDWARQAQELMSS